METGFTKADSSNLPKVDAMMVGKFFARNSDFCSAEFRNTKTSISSRQSYGDDAVSYVQLRRDDKLCTVKCKICPEHKIHSKLYAATMIVDEEDDVVLSVECHDCIASQGGCKHAVAFLMWVHRRSEEPSCTSVECYWRKSKLAKVGTSLKYITSKELVNSRPSLPSNNSVYLKFLDEGRKRSLQKCELIRYQTDYSPNEMESISMHLLVIKYNEKCCDNFFKKLVLRQETVIKIEEETRDQYKSKLWHELRYGRITASRAYEVTRCKTTDGLLMSLIMGGKIPDTPAMKRGKTLEDAVRKTAEVNLGKKIKTCGLVLSTEYPMIPGSPDGIFEDGVIEIKCPMSLKTTKNYIQDGKPTKKYFAQMQIQMSLTGTRKCFFCIADCDYQNNSKVDIVSITFDEEYASDLLKASLEFWKVNVYPLLYQSIQ